MSKSSAVYRSITLAGTLCAGCTCPPKTVEVSVDPKPPATPVGFYDLYKLDPDAPWIGIKNPGVECKDLFPAFENEGELLSRVDLKDVLNAMKAPQAVIPLLASMNKGFCIYRPQPGGTLTVEQVEALATELAGQLAGLRPDVSILGGSGDIDPGDDERMWTALGLRRMVEYQALFRRPIAGFNLKKRAVLVLDDTPAEFIEEASFAGIHSPPSLDGHGPMVAQVIRDVACGSIGCPNPPVDIRYLQALNVATKGGPAGSLTQLYTMLVMAAAHQEPAVVNLSLGWAPIKFTYKGDQGRASTYQQDLVVALGASAEAMMGQLADAPTALVVHGLLLASCSDKAVIAGAGNGTLLYPAAFGAVPLTKNLCGVVGSLFDPKAFADPRIVYAVVGLDLAGDPVYPPPAEMQGHDDVPSFKALGKAVTRTSHAGWNSFMGASVASAVVSGVLATQWGYFPGIGGHAAVEKIRPGVNGASPAPHPVRLCQTLSDQCTSCVPALKCNEASADNLDDYIEHRHTTEVDLPDGPLPWAPVGPIQTKVTCALCR